MGVFSKILGQAATTAGNLLNRPLYVYPIGGAPVRVQLPELHVSETLSKIGSALNPVGTVKAAETGPMQSDPYSGAYSNQGYPNPVPTSSGPSTTPSSGGTIIPTTNGNQDVNLTDAAYQQARAQIEAMNPLLEQSYGQGKTDIQNAIDEAVQAGEKQKTDVNTRYSNILANMLKTYQDLGRQRQGTFSSLGTLDSSAFGEQQARADQSLAENRAATETAQAQDINSIEQNINAYKKQAESSLANLALQYQAGKNAITAALANNDISGAAAIKSTIDNIRNQALTIASLLNPTLGSIQGITGDTTANNVSRLLANLTATGNSTYTLPTSNQDVGSGFWSNGKWYKNYQDYLNSFNISA